MLLLNKGSDAGITGFKEKKLFPQKINNRIVVIGPEFLKFLCSYGETFNKFSVSDRKMLSCCLGLFCLDSFAEAGGGGKLSGNPHVPLCKYMSVNNSAG